MTTIPMTKQQMQTRSQELLAEVEAALKGSTVSDIPKPGIDARIKLAHVYAQLAAIPEGTTTQSTPLKG